jgi:pimeloyl-ACP methyl ester carboxylesterase
MKTARLSLLLSAVLVASVASLACGGAEPKPTATPATSASAMTTPPLPPGPEGRARALVLALSRGDYAHADVAFDPALAAALPPEKLRELWDTLQKAGGTYKAITNAEVLPKEAGTIVNLTVQFERLRKIVRVAIDRGDHAIGLFYGPVAEDLQQKVRAVMEAANKGDFVLASADFAQVMKDGLPPPKFQATWAGIERNAGKWQSLSAFELTPQGTTWTVRARAKFEKDELVVEAVFDAEDRIVGLFAKAPPVEWAAPAYASADKLEERDVTVGSAPALPGTLTLPKGAPGPVAAVVLVHGSGPNDRDETVGANKPFKDLAWGLATKGIAVLRYEKRSKASPTGIVTQHDEVEVAAHDAIELLKKTPGVDPKRIFVVGHSQGGYLAPRIAQQNAASLAGVVMLAGSTRPLQDSILAQFKYFQTLTPNEPALGPLVDAAMAFKKKVEDPKLGKDEDVALPTGGSAKGAYFLDVRGYDPPAVAEKLTLRILILQGERDYQVTVKEDYEGWKKRLQAKKNVTLKTYPGLNHLFIAGTGASQPGEYQVPGHVDEAVVRDVSTWIAGK